MTHARNFFALAGLLMLGGMCGALIAATRAADRIADQRNWKFEL